MNCVLLVYFVSLVLLVLFMGSQPAEIVVRNLKISYPKSLIADILFESYSRPF